MHMSDSMVLYMIAMSPGTDARGAGARARRMPPASAVVIGIPNVKIYARNRAFAHLVSRVSDRRGLLASPSDCFS
jgi:hypothetical protein